MNAVARNLDIPGITPTGIDRSVCRYCAVGCRYSYHTARLLTGGINAVNRDASTGKNDGSAIVGIAAEGIGTRIDRTCRNRPITFNINAATLPRTRRIDTANGNIAISSKIDRPSAIE